MYRIIGADGKEYGPISAGQVRQWIAENRANASTPTLTEGAMEWKPLASIPEFSLLFTASAPLAPAGVWGTKTNGFAVTGFVLGMLSFCLFCCCVGPFGGILGIIFSLIGLSQINSRPDVYRGKGFAIAGLVLSILGVVFYFVMMAFGLAIGAGEGTHHVYRL